MVTRRDYYEVLRLSKGASGNEIKRAYRKLSRKYHPDINKKPDAEGKFREVSEAYEILSDPQKRAVYDQYEHAGTNPNYGAGGAGGGFGGFGDFSGDGFGGFEDIFGSFSGEGGRSVDPNTSRRGADLQYTIDLSFEKAILSVEKEVKYSRGETCHTCGGNGTKPGMQPTTYHKCHDVGTINTGRQTPFGRVMSRQTYDVCHDTGKRVKEPCPTCHGSGYEKKAHSVKVSIPAGIEEGQQMYLAGRGEARRNGGPFGDLYVVFRAEESSIFDHEDSEIYYELPLSFVQAALGDEVQVPTAHRDVKPKIPAGTQTGTDSYLRRKGAPKLRGGATGDQHVKVKPITSRNLNEQQREALRAFAEVDGIKVEEQQEGGFFGKFKNAFGGKKRKWLF